MPRKVLLVSTNRCASPEPVFPLGLAYLNAALLRAGHTTAWIDLQTDSRAELERALVEGRPDVIGLSLRNIDDVLIRTQETFYPELVSLCHWLRGKTAAPLILGGSGFSIYPARLLELSGADYGIRGEGELSFLALLESRAGVSPAPTRPKGRREACPALESIPGLVFRRAGKVVVNPQAPAPLREELMPQAAIVPERPARLISHYLRTSGILNVQTQRGCPFGCCFCTYPVIEGRVCRRRSGEAVAAEFEQLQQAGAKYVFIVDSVFNTSAAHVTEVCEALLRRNLKVRWGCFLRPQGLTADLLRLMARAGLGQIEFGTDSFCDEVLQAYGKGFTFDDVLRASDLACEANVDYCHFLIAGGPRETTATLQAGFRNSQRLKGAVIMAVAGMRIYPGTELCERAITEGVIERQADLLAPVYYLAPGLTAAGVLEQLRAFALESPAWIIGDPPPGYTVFVQRLRQRGIAGPLWSYFARMQRLWPMMEVRNSKSEGRKQPEARRPNSETNADLP